MMNEEYWFIKETTPNQTEAKKLLQLELLMLGFKKGDYRFDDDGWIVIENWDNIKRSLDKYRAKHGSNE